MVERFWKPAYDLVKKNNKQLFWGTWDSNPGPNDRWPTHHPLRHLPVFVNIITSEYNIWKISNMLKNKQKRAYFELSTQRLTRPSSSLFVPVKNK